MFMKDNIPFSRQYTHICRADTCCIILNSRSNSDSKKQHKMQDKLCGGSKGLVGHSERAHETV